MGETLTPQPTAAPAQAPAGNFDDFLKQYAPAGQSAPPPAQSLDEFFHRYADSPQQALDLTMGPRPEGSAIHDMIFGDPRINSTARVLDQIGYGAAQNWGARPLGEFDPELHDILAKAGFVRQYDDTSFSLAKMFNEGLLRGAASVYDIATRGPSALLGAVQGGIAQTGEELGVAPLARDVAGIVESELALGHPSYEAPTPRPVPELAQARALGVVGEGEAGWKGTAEPYPDKEATRAAARAQAFALEQGEAKPETAEPQPGIETPRETAEPAPPPDIHAVARQIAPEVFEKYDRLTDIRDRYRRWIDDLKETQAERLAPQHKEGLKPIQDQIDTLEARPRLTNAQQNRLNGLYDQHDDIVARQQEELTTDTHDMQLVRQKLQQTDFEMRDLAPDVSRAYQKAQAQMPAPEMAAITEPVEPVPAARAPEPEAPLAEQPSPAEAAPAEMPSALPGNIPIVPSIADDVMRKLITANRPTEEAQAAAQVVEARYQARAAGLGGNVTPQELYAQDNVGIRGATKGGPGGAAAGRTSIRDGRKIVTLFDKADQSTFLHEMGHAWLEDLMKDEQDPRATLQLKQDAATVRDWLNAKEPEGGVPASITRNQHERFARGFEQYLMEGRAPSTGLAGVFAKFKDWLTQIYGTVSKLGRPINDEIRGVFDRMLASPESERPVIAPERETPADLGARHEALVDSTPPERATETADRIRDERHDEARTDAAIADRIGLGTGAGGGAVADRAGAGPELEPVSAGVGGQSGAVGAGGDQAAPESGGARAEQPDAPRDAVQPLGRAPDRLIDKAGNIRLENLNTPESVNQVIREAATQNNDFWQARRGVISDAETLDLADALGMRPADLDRRKIGEAFNAEQIIAARKLLVQSATNLRDLATKAAEGSDAELAAYVAARDRHVMIQGQVSGVTAEAGRALRAFRDMAGMEGSAEARAVGDLLQDATGRTLYQMRDEAKRMAALDTPQKISKFARDVQKPSLGDMILEAWVNGLISGPITHSTYAVGNALQALWKAVLETAAQATAGKIREAITGEAPTVRYGEIGAQLYSIFGKGLTDGIKAGWQSVKLGQTMELPGETEAATTPFTQQKAIPGIAGAIIRAPGERLVAPIHSFFRMLGYEQGIAAQAYRAASDEGLSGNAFAARVADLTQNPTPEMMAAARTGATQQTLMGRGGAFTQAVSRLTNISADLPVLGNTRLLKFIAPFTKVSSNIIEQALLERTPLGILAPSIRADLIGANGRLAQDVATGRMAAGTALGLLGGVLASQGNLFGSAPSDPRERAMWILTHGQPHSARVGNMTYEVNRLGPIGELLSFSADLYSLVKEIPTEDASQIAHSLTYAFYQNVLDMSAMAGPAELIQAIEDPDRYGKNYINNFLSSFVPFNIGLSQVARQVDPYSRQARDLIDKVKAKIPFVSEELYPRRDVWGEPVLNRSFVGVYAARMNNDPVNQILTQLRIFPPMPERQIRGVELTDRQYDDFCRVAGRTAKQQLDALVRQPGFTSLPGDTQARVIRPAIDSARESAASLIMLENPSIIRRATQNKLDPLHKQKTQ